jgi:hypothetical protein
MIERLASQPPEPRRENIQAFWGSKNMPFSMDKHLEKGITPTNNFKKWFLRDDEPVRNQDGTPNPKSYKNQPWGAIMEDFRDKNDVLWKDCKATAQAYQDAMEEHLAIVIATGSVSKEADEFRKAAYWEMAGNLHKAFHAMLPELEHPEDPADYIDPLELCR